MYTHCRSVPESSAGFDCRYGGGVCLADSMCDRLTLLHRAHNADMIYCTLQAAKRTCFMTEAKSTNMHALSSVLTDYMICW